MTYNPVTRTARLWFEALLPSTYRLVVSTNVFSELGLPLLEEFQTAFDVLADVTDPTLAPGGTKTVLDADLAKSETSFLVPKQFLEPGRIYEFEVLATEKYGNQTITEGGVFCTSPLTEADCEAP